MGNIKLHTIVPRIALLAQSILIPIWGGFMSCNVLAQICCLF